MAGLIFGSTDFDATYGFKIRETDFGTSELEWNIVPIPGREGVVVLGDTRIKPGQIAIEGRILGSSYNDIRAKIIAIDLELGVRRFNTAYDPVNFAAAPRPSKDLYIPFFTGYKFPGCRCFSTRTKIYQGWPLQSTCIYNIVFFQEVPRMDPTI